MIQVTTVNYGTPALTHGSTLNYTTLPTTLALTTCMKTHNDDYMLETLIIGRFTFNR